MFISKSDGPYHLLLDGRTMVDPMDYDWYIVQVSLQLDRSNLVKNTEELFFVSLAAK